MLPARIAVPCPSPSTIVRKVLLRKGIALPDKLVRTGERREGNVDFAALALDGKKVKAQFENASDSCKAQHKARIVNLTNTPRMILEYCPD